MENEERKKIVYEGELDLAGYAIPCYVLEDGTRVLSTLGMQNALKMNAYEGDRSSVRLTRSLAAKNLQILSHPGKNVAHEKVVTCYKGEKKVNGYEATALADVCDLYLEARKHIDLGSKQKAIADQCEILIRGFARVGIIALIDEATGYQYERERFELQKVLNAYISDEILKWQLTFTDEFYRHIFRLWNIPFTAQGIKKRPGVIGKLTVKYIYSQLPKEVINKIKENSERLPNGGYKYRWHQSLSTDIGREHLKKQINEVIAIMSISDTKEQFIKLFNKRYSDYEQIEFDFDEPSNNIAEIKKPTTSSEFSQQISLFDDFQ